MSLQIPNLKPLFPIGRCRMTVFDFTNQIDQVYRGLGIPTLYGVLSILANKSVFFIGERGTGKTRTINLIPPIGGTEISKWDTFTLEELNKYCCDLAGELDYIENKHMVFNVEDFSTLSDYHREIFLTVCSKVSSDGNYIHSTKQLPCLDIRNCKLTLLIAIQPRLYSLLCDKYTQWESMSSGRFTKFLLLNPLRSETAIIPLVPTLPREITHKVTLNENEVNLDALTAMFREHTSEGRATLYARDYATAMARFVGAETVKQRHVDLFHKLFFPYLNSFAVLQKAENLDSPVRVTTGCMKLLGEIGKYSDYVTKHELARKLHVEERSIERPAKQLLKVGLIEKPSPHAGRYRLSKFLREFFNWYSGLLS